MPGERSISKIKKHVPKGGAKYDETTVKAFCKLERNRLFSVFNDDEIRTEEKSNSKHSSNQSYYQLKLELRRNSCRQEDGITVYDDFRTNLHEPKKLDFFKFRDDDDDDDDANNIGNFHQFTALEKCLLNYVIQTCSSFEIAMKKSSFFRLYMAWIYEYESKGKGKPKKGYLFCRF
jgi:CRISPR/Cas system CSM-associated protein Csm2 small subunit